MSMTLVEASYEQVRDAMRPGDMIAFSGKGAFSEIIKSVTRSGVSHVAAVLNTNVAGEDRVQIIESTSLDGFLGVSISFLSQRLKNYDGEVWWFPLSNENHEKLDVDSYLGWLLAQHNKPYDLQDAIKAGLDALGDFGGLTYAREDFTKLFCSELLAGAQEKGKLIGSINASEVTPKDEVKFNLWFEYYYQIKGEFRRLHGCGTIDPEGFGI